MEQPSQVRDSPIFCLYLSRMLTSSIETSYYLNDLPAGYGMFEIDQPGGPQTYKRLFGHPSGKFYDSVPRFEPHFFWMLDGKTGICKCVNCGHFQHAPGPPRQRTKVDIKERVIRAPNPTGRLGRPRLDTKTSTDGDTSSRADSVTDLARPRERRNRNAEVAFPVDGEGTFNVYKEAITKLYNQRDSAKDSDISLLEKGSIDWTAEREALPEYLTQIESQHAFVPRKGELVLWCVTIPDGHAVLRDENGKYRLYNFREKGFSNYPRWRAGVVAGVPSAESKNGTVDFPDILDTPVKQTAMNTAGFRIETMPDPNDDIHKSLSKQYRYVPLQNIRPLSFWQFILAGIPQEELHASILFALTCMTSISVAERTKVLGHWQQGAHVSAKACYLGSELIVIGDTIRLVPRSSQNSCTDILVVDSIRLQLNGLKEDHLRNDSPMLCTNSEVRFVGRAFTLGTSFPRPQPLQKDEIPPTFRPIGTAKYGNWYPLHDMHKKYEVSHDQVLGRLYEADAIGLWTGRFQKKLNREELLKIKPDLGVDYESILAGRRYATKADERIPELPPNEPTGTRWLLSDHRAQALAVATINGKEVAAFHEIRTKSTLREWHLMTCIHNAVAPIAEESGFERKRINYDVRAAFDANLGLSQEVSREHDTGRRRGRKPGSKLVDGKIVTAEQLAQLVGNNGVSENGKHPLEVIDLDDDDPEDMTSHEYERQPTVKSSQMANAGMDDADEELIEKQEEFYDVEEIEAPTVRRRTLKSRLAMYDDDDDDDDDEEDSDAMEDVEVSEWQTGRLGNRPPPSKSQIMQSVEDEEDGGLDNVEEYGSEDEDDYTDLDKWTMPPARGGTEESVGGGYRPGESQ